MTVAETHRRPAEAGARGRRPSAAGTLAGLVVAVAAALALLLLEPVAKTAPPPGGRVAMAQAWPHAKRIDFDPALADGPLFTPLAFLDTTTVLGTAPTPDARWVRLLLIDIGARRPATGSVLSPAVGSSPAVGASAAGGLRELRRLPLGSNPQFEAVTAAGDDLVWTESTDAHPVQLWHGTRGGGPARMLTADTGDALFFGNQFDLVIADGQVHWAAAAKSGKSTDIRSVPLTGGPVRIRTETGQWALSAWPWLVDDQERRLRNLATVRDTEVVTDGPELTTCGPVWCRAMVMGAGGLARIDLVHPDGSGRRRMAGSAAQAAVTDVAVLDRFEVLDEPAPDADLTGKATLLVYDAATDRTVLIASAAGGAFTNGGMLWWSTGDDDAPAWHAVDLRTA